MTRVNTLRLKVTTNKIIAKKVNTANHFIFEGKSLLPEPALDEESTATLGRILKKMARFHNPAHRASDKDLYDRFHDPHYRS